MSLAGRRRTMTDPSQLDCDATRAVHLQVEEFHTTKLVMEIPTLSGSDCSTRHLLPALLFSKTPTHPHVHSFN